MLHATDYMSVDFGSKMQFPESESFLVEYLR
uniref:Uncharacterized protein n=1 Tax=Arundo donax TaxID=35708 RepID=A0A0A9FCI1_ARUDO